MLLTDTDYTDLETYDLFLTQHQANEKLQQYSFLLKYFDEINALDIKNFNTLLFKEDFQNLTEDEFYDVYNSIIDEIIERNMFDFELLMNPEQTEFTATNFIDFIDFYMHTLPYVYLKNILAKFESIPEFYEYMMDDKNNIKTDLKEEALRTINLNSKFTGLVRDLGTNIVSAKNKDKYNSIVGLLDLSINTKKDLFNKYIELIDNVSISQLQDLITKYITNDPINLKG